MEQHDLMFAFFVRFLNLQDKSSRRSLNTLSNHRMASRSLASEGCLKLASRSWTGLAIWWPIMLFPVYRPEKHISSYLVDEGLWTKRRVPWLAGKILMAFGMVPATGRRTLSKVFAGGGNAVIILAFQWSIIKTKTGYGQMSQHLRRNMLERGCIKTCPYSPQWRCVMFPPQQRYLAYCK